MFINQANSVAELFTNSINLPFSSLIKLLTYKQFEMCDVYFGECSNFKLFQRKTITKLQLLKHNHLQLQLKYHAGGLQAKPCRTHSTLISYITSVSLAK